MDLKTKQEFHKIVNLLVKTTKLQLQPHMIRILINALESKSYSQFDVCKLLTSKGLSAIFKLLSNESATMRKLSAKFLCELAFKNESTQLFLCEKFSFTPVYGKVSINKIPDHIQIQLKQNPKVLYELKEIYDSNIGATRNEKYWSFPVYHKSQIHTPMRPPSKQSMDSSAQMHHNDSFGVHHHNFSDTSSTVLYPDVIEEEPIISKDEERLISSDSIESIDFPDPAFYLIGFFSETQNKNPPVPISNQFKYNKPKKTKPAYSRNSNRAQNLSVSIVQQSKKNEKMNLSFNLRQSSSLVNENPITPNHKRTRLSTSTVDQKIPFKKSVTEVSNKKTNFSFGNRKNTGNFQSPRDTHNSSNNDIVEKSSIKSSSKVTSSTTKKKKMVFHSRYNSNNIDEGICHRSSTVKARTSDSKTAASSYITTPKNSRPLHDVNQTLDFRPSIELPKKNRPKLGISSISKTTGRETIMMSARSAPTKKKIGNPKKSFTPSKQPEPKFKYGIHAPQYKTKSNDYPENIIPIIEKKNQARKDYKSNPKQIPQPEESKNEHEFSFKEESNPLPIAAGSGSESAAKINKIKINNFIANPNNFSSNNTLKNSDRNTEKEEIKNSDQCLGRYIPQYSKLNNKDLYFDELENAELEKSNMRIRKETRISEIDISEDILSNQKSPIFTEIKEDKELADISELSEIYSIENLPISPIKEANPHKNSSQKSHSKSLSLNLKETVPPTLSDFGQSSNQMTEINEVTEEADYFNDEQFDLNDLNESDEDLNDFTELSQLKQFKHFDCEADLDEIETQPIRNSITTGSKSSTVTRTPSPKSGISSVSKKKGTPNPDGKNFLKLNKLKLKSIGESSKNSNPTTDQLLTSNHQSGGLKSLNTTVISNASQEIRDIASKNAFGNKIQSRTTRRTTSTTAPILSHSNKNNESSEGSNNQKKAIDFRKTPILKSVKRKNAINNDALRPFSQASSSQSTCRKIKISNQAGSKAINTVIAASKRRISNPGLFNSHPITPTENKLNKFVRIKEKNPIQKKSAASTGNKNFEKQK